MQIYVPVNPEYIDNGKTSTEINPIFWAHIYVGLRYMNSLIKKDIALDSHPENMQKEVLRFIKYDDTLSWGVNMFSIIDAQSQEAIVYTGTFGALVEGGKGSFLNNLFYYSHFAFPNTGGHNNDLYPIIIYDNQQIRLAYSGNGGYTTRTAALPRMITVLALNIFFNQPIEKAITTPLIYPNYDGRLVSDGFPLNYGDILKVFKKEGNYGRISSDQYPGDSLVAIEQRKGGLHNIDLLYIF
uniref:Gamma-glutamyltranspeptidase n=1 Tax=Heterorhabditis bacteriophora TaxID=37862 RepID=A0A1I7XIF7_HETBA